MDISTAYEEGDIIVFKPESTMQRTVRVTVKEADIKYGKPGFEGRLIQPGPNEWPEVWGYDDQIVRVFERGGVSLTQQRQLTRLIRKALVATVPGEEAQQDAADALHAALSVLGAK